jgi:hypothetical protein
MQVSEDARRSILVLTEADQGNLGGLVAFRSRAVCGGGGFGARGATLRPGTMVLLALRLRGGIVASLRFPGRSGLAVQHFVGVGSFVGEVSCCGIGELL